ncbi:MAG: DUF4160 domain-containing protein [Rhodospirillaceae bacterium]|nr:DUF4160 domain-containing protein [Rhodospirillaceae bacterium]
MPTIDRFGQLRVVIYPNDHRPAHVHVMGRGLEVVIDLNCPKGPPRLRENFGFPRREITHVCAVLQSRLSELCTAWERIHG